MNFVKYSGISAKLSALSSEFLTTEDYKALVSQSSVQDVVRYLVGTKMYMDTLGNINTDQIHRRQLEIELQEDLLKDLKKIFIFFVTFDKNFSNLMFQRYEIENLKLALREALIEPESKTKMENLKEKFFDLGEWARIDPVKIATSANRDEIIDNLSGTPYQEVIRNVFSSYKETMPANLIGAMENGLDSWIFSKITESALKMGAQDQAIVKELIGERADMIDTEWVVRAKTFYNIKAEELYNTLLPYHFRLRPSNLHAMCDAKGIKELLDVLKDGPYRELYKDMNDETLPERITIQNRRYLRIKSKNAVMKFGVFSIASFFHYFLLKEFEIDDMVTIVEGVRYNLKPDEIKELLIFQF